MNKWIKKKDKKEDKLYGNEYKYNNIYLSIMYINILHSRMKM